MESTRLSDKYFDCLCTANCIKTNIYLKLTLFTRNGTSVPKAMIRYDMFCEVDDEIAARVHRRTIRAKRNVIRIVLKSGFNVNFMRIIMHDFAWDYRRARLEDIFGQFKKVS